MRTQPGSCSETQTSQLSQPFLRASSLTFALTRPPIAMRARVLNTAVAIVQKYCIGSRHMQKASWTGWPVPTRLRCGCRGLIHPCDGGGGLRPPPVISPISRKQRCRVDQLPFACSPRADVLDRAVAMQPLNGRAALIANRRAQDRVADIEAFSGNHPARNIIRAQQLPGCGSEHAKAESRQWT